MNSLNTPPPIPKAMGLWQGNHLSYEVVSLLSLEMFNQRLAFEMPSEGLLALGLRKIRESFKDGLCGLQRWASSVSTKMADMEEALTTLTS